MAQIAANPDVDAVFFDDVDTPPSLASGGPPETVLWAQEKKYALLFLEFKEMYTAVNPCGDYFLGPCDIPGGPNRERRSTRARSAASPGPARCGSGSAAPIASEAEAPSVLANLV